MNKLEKLQPIQKHYPEAVTTIDTFNWLIDFVKNELGIHPSQVMLADSICSDDVNSIQYPARMNEFLGPFKMGGLDGFPFTGITGMRAFAKHVPDNGALVIYYGPHIGVTKDAEIGTVHRFGQTDRTTCCGAASAALEKLQSRKIFKGIVTELDYQMNKIEQMLLNESERILTAKSPIAEATQVIYEATNERMNELVEATSFHGKYVVLAGVILINGDSGLGSFNQVNRLDVIDLSDKKVKSYLKNFKQNSL